MLKILISLAVTVLFLANAEVHAAMTLQSKAFKTDSDIPRLYTCEGSDASPPLQWDNPPPGTKSFALIVDDPDAPDPKAPQRTWVHWVVYNLPATARELGEALPAPPTGAKFGLNDWKKEAWGGPCPPIGKHRYFHKLFALDTVLKFAKPPTKAQLEESMRGHILAQAELIGLYQKAPH